MEDENKDIEKDKIVDEIVVSKQFCSFFLILALVCIVSGLFADDETLFWFGIAFFVLFFVFLLYLIIIKCSIKVIIEKIRKKTVKVFKTIFSNVCSILSSPITTNVILIIIVCMLSGIKCSVINYHLSSYSITSAIKDALDDYGFIQLRRY